MALKIIDKTGDKVFFTIVPNIVVNHTTHYEQALYLVMKRIAGEHGTCYASIQTLAKKIGAGMGKTSEALKKLKKKGWIKQIGKRPTKTKPVREYAVKDIWKENMDYYEKIKRESSLGEQSFKQRKFPGGTKKVPQGKQRRIIYKKNNKKNIIKIKKFSSLEDISEKELVEISQRYKVPLAFVKLQFEKMRNWLEAKGKRYKNYKRALMNWVLRGAEEKIERRQGDEKKRGVDARYIK